MCNGVNLRYYKIEIGGGRDGVLWKKNCWILLAGAGRVIRETSTVICE